LWRDYQTEAALFLKRRVVDDQISSLVSKPPGGQPPSRERTRRIIPHPVGDVMQLVIAKLANDELPSAVLPGGQSPGPIRPAI
jgi:hypothetical protein